MTDLIFCLHNHQPVGNFPEVLEKAYKKSYLPVLETFSRYPEFKLSLHITGFLLDWTEAEHPEFITLLREMIERGQVELMGGGFYEPILSVLPERDRVGQIRMMSDRIEELFGVRPRGMWLAERIWDQSLPSTMKAAGMEYVVVDDFHFIKAGVSPEDLSGYFVTEDRGSPVNVFAGSERMRYLIPFRSHDEVENFLRSSNDEDKTDLLVYADDGEKFGVWPKTYEWVFEEGWLEGFMERVCAIKGTVNFTTFSEHMDSSAPVGRVYLPGTSYMEMGEWTLPAEAGAAYAELLKFIHEDESLKPVKRFLQGGTWRGFFSKYPESNWMHKRMLLASADLLEVAGSIDAPQREAATRLLYMAQCNDAYWHGVFGGLYLPHLRGAIYDSILNAEEVTDTLRGRPPVSEADVDADGSLEVILKSESLNLFISPGEGGSLQELDFLPKRINLSNTLTRWFEAYHLGLMKEDDDVGVKEPVEDLREETGAIATIHDAPTLSGEELREYLLFDSDKRASFVERLLPCDISIESYKDGSFEELDFINGGPLDYELRDKGIVFTSVDGAAGTHAPLMDKEYTLTGPGSFRVDYSLSRPLTVGEEEGARFAVELNLILPACDGPATRFLFEEGALVGDDHGLAVTGALKSVKEIALEDLHTGVRVTIEADRAATLWRFPIETLSQSEAGFERIFQGSCLVFLYEPGDAPFKCGFNVTVEEI